jgi:hypothetical protein
MTPAASGFDYAYRVENQAAASQVLNAFAVYAEGAGGPLAQVTPAPWRSAGVIADTNYYRWSIWRAPGGLAAGTAAGGFGFTQAPLPAVARFLAWGKTDLRDLPRFPAGMAPESCEGRDVIQNSFKGTTIGPKPPDSKFVPLSFLNYLISLVHESRQQGWITRDGTHKSLLAKLVAAKRAMEDGLEPTAKQQVGAFVHEVQATACQDFTCGANLPLTSEAYALLYHNGRYLHDRLARPGRQQ